MGLRLARHLGALGTIDPGQYAVDGPCVFVSCPKCGCVDDVSVTNPPPRSGILPLEWRCPTVTCGWRDYLSLDSWGES